MNKKIDINKTIFEIIKDNPEIKDKLIDLGFKGLSNPLMLKTMGKKMSIRRGASMLGVENVEEKLEGLGYEVYDSYNDKEVSQRRKLIKSYVERLSNGEDLESVKKDFRENFSNVSSSEIMDAEEALLEEGLPREEVQRLCDVHSSLFHGKTETENDKDLELIKVKGHPLRFFYEENQEVKKIISKIKENIEDENNQKEFLEIGKHYRKKGDLIYPLLKEKYNKPGPSEVMWAVDIEISNNFKKASKKKDFDELKRVLERAEEMTYKEDNILYPLMEDIISKEDFIGLYFDLSDYDNDLVEREVWEKAEESKTKLDKKEGYVNFSKGRLKVEELEAMLDTLEIEITFVDKNDINSYYNDTKGKKTFKRPATSLGREVYSCHPPQVEAVVRNLIKDFKEGKKDRFQIIKNIKGTDHAVTYYAVRDKEGKYQGVLETVQDLSFYTDYLKTWNRLK